MSCSELETERLLLRAPRSEDAARIVPLANVWEVAKNLGRLPHPYVMADAEDFIARAGASRAAGTDFNFMVTRKNDGALMGGAGLHLRARGNFELGYWFGQPFWGHGYASEAARRLVSFAFRDLKIERLIAGWYHDNPASGRVLAKLGCVMSGAEQRDCVARGHAVYCHIVTLTPTAFAATRKQTEAA